MYKIGDFSRMSKTTIKALRYYEKEGLLKKYQVTQFIIAMESLVTLAT